MGTEFSDAGAGRLSAEEERAWDLLVEEGRKIRAPIVARQEQRRLENRLRYLKGGGTNPRKRKGVRTRDSLLEVPVGAKRWVVMRFAGISFAKAGERCGATWVEIQECRARNEDFRCAVAAMEENSRQLMKAKAMSVVEQSQDEGAKVSLAQTQLSMRILESIDREHFGERPASVGAEAEQTSSGGGGFVINVIGDAAAVCARPVPVSGKALVYTDV